MTVPRFDRDFSPTANAAHIARHRVTPAEAEQVFHDPRIAWAGISHARGEWRFAFIGRTAAGRILYVVVTPRDGMVRVVTAYRANRYQAIDFPHEGDS